MDWKQPHSRRLPTTAEYSENVKIIQELDAKIAILTEEIQGLEFERNTRRSFIAPFRRLPPEILCQVASECIKLGESPLTLNQVCYSMREAVNGMKIFWTKIFLTKKLEYSAFLELESNEYIHCVSGKFLQILLSRAKPLPLSIIMEEPESMSDFIELLSADGGSIKSMGFIERETCDSDEASAPSLWLNQVRDMTIDLEGNTFPRIQWLRRGLETSLHSLSKLTIRAEYPYLCKILQDVPLPQTLDLYLELFSNDEEFFTYAKLHLPDIRHLEVQGDPDLLRFIQVSKLDSFRFSGNDPDRDLLIEEIPAPNEVKSVDLEQIEVSTEDNNMYNFPKLSKIRLGLTRSGILSTFMVPCLEDLTLIDIDPLHSMMREGFFPNNRDSERKLVCEILNGEDMFSQFTLKCLTLGRMLLHKSIPSKLKVQPNLSTLQITECHVSRRFLKWLSNLGGQSKQILPSLELIHLVECTSKDEDYSLQRFIQDCAIGRPATRVLVE